MAENAFFAIFSLKIRTWTTMPLKVGIVATFRGPLTSIMVPGTGIYQGPGIFILDKIKNIINQHQQNISKK